MRGANEISNTDNVIDSRDIIDRIEYLESEREPLTDAVDQAQEAVNDLDGNDFDEVSTFEEAEQEAKDALKAAYANVKDWDESDEGQELAKLKAFAEEAEGYAEDWRHGATLIHEDYFEDYARDLAAEGDYDMKNEQWPYTCIDWAKAAEELQQDYTSVDFGGETYWVR
jgi:uncharacterized protein (UPF0335 family)